MNNVCPGESFFHSTPMVYSIGVCPFSIAIECALLSNYVVNSVTIKRWHVSGITHAFRHYCLMDSTQCSIKIFLTGGGGKNFYWGWASAPPCPMLATPLWPHPVYSYIQRWTDGVKLIILRNAQTAKPNTILVLHIQCNAWGPLPIKLGGGGMDPPNFRENQ